VRGIRHLPAEASQTNTMVSKTVRANCGAFKMELAGEQVIEQNSDLSLSACMRGVSPELLFTDCHMILPLTRASAWQWHCLNGDA
jgi:hypothetical protein